MHHVELLPDPAAEAAVRSQWDRLTAAGLPSLADHRSPSNRPHMTVTMVSDWTAGAIDDVVGGVTLPVELGPLVCFGAGPWVLVRLVVPTAALLDLHRRVTENLGTPSSPFCEVGRWIPHVSLANRLDATQLAAAVELLSPGPVITTQLGRARHWDSGARVEESLNG